VDVGYNVWDKLLYAVISYCIIKSQNQLNKILEGLITCIIYGERVLAGYLWGIQNQQIFMLSLNVGKFFIVRLEVPIITR